PAADRGLCAAPDSYDMTSARTRLAFAIVLIAAAGWTLAVGKLAVNRHEQLQTNAFDLGYVSQAIWYDAHGEPFRFTTVQGISTLLEGVDPSAIRHPHWLLAFHVEPALLLLAPVFRLDPDPRLLLWIQAAGLAAGALAATALALRLTASELLAAAFGLAYLLAPGLEAAALSDFHMVAIGAALLMVALWLLESRRYRLALASFALAALAREDAALTVAWIGAVVLVRDFMTRRASSSRWATGGKLRRTALIMAAAAGLWTLLSIGVIEPFFNGSGNVFAARYAWIKAGLLAVARHGDAALLLSQLEGAAQYLAAQALTGSLLILAAPMQLATAIPLIAVNALSGFDWMRSAGGHYSALLVPLLLWAGMHGARNVRERFNAAKAKPGLGVAFALVVLVCPLAAQVWIGIPPASFAAALANTNDRGARIQQSLGRIPPSASISATSSLYPQLSARHDAYWFPSSERAGWPALDVAGNDHPLSAAEMRDAAISQLSHPRADLAAADDGLLLIRDDGTREGLLSDEPADHTLGAVLKHDPAVLPASFYDFVRIDRVPFGRETGPLRFGPSLTLVGCGLTEW